MRKLILGGVALVALVAAYWSWALAGAAELAASVARGDVQATMQRVDLPALRHSLGSQIVRAYLRQNPKTQKLGPFGLALAGGVGGGVADALLREALTPENIAAMLGQGHLVAAKAAGAEPLWRMPPFDEMFRGGPLKALAASYFDAPTDFVIVLDNGGEQFGVHLAMSGMTWRLAGLDIPEALSDRLAREVAARGNA